MTTIDTLTVNVDADTKAFEAKLVAMAGQANAFSGAISRAFKDAVAGGRDFEAVLASLLLRLSNMALEKALEPLSNLIGGLIGNLFGAFGLGGRGGPALNAPHFAKGGVVAAPTLFPLARGLGLMGEAGAEAVLPLARGNDGALGVRTSAAAPVIVNFNIATADADSFRKSETQVTAMLARAVGRGRRGL